MANLTKFVYWAGLLFLLAATAAYGQDLGTLQGSVKDPSGALISGASVSLKSVVSNTSQRTQTGANGDFAMKDIPFGAYTLEVEHPGFVPLIQAVQVNAATPNLELTMALKSVVTSVEVQANRDEIQDTLSPGTVTVVYPDDVKGEFKSLPELLDQIPGVYVNRVAGTAQYTTVSVRGSSPTEVNIYVDGVPFNLASEVAADLSTFSPSNVERVEVYRGVVPARFSGAPIGGAINIVTKKPTSFNFAGSAGARTLGGRQFSVAANGPLGKGKLFGGGNLLFGADEERSTGDFHYQDFQSQSYQNLIYPNEGPAANLAACSAASISLGYGGAGCGLPIDRTRMNNGFSKDNVLAKWQNNSFVAKVSYLYMDRLLPAGIGTSLATSLEHEQDLPDTPIGDNPRHYQQLRQTEAVVGWNHNFGKLNADLLFNLMDQDKEYTSPDEPYPENEDFGARWSHYHTRRYGTAADATYELNAIEGLAQRVEFHADWVQETLHACESLGPAANDPPLFGCNGSNSTPPPFPIPPPSEGLIPLYTRYTTTAQVQDTLIVRFLHNLEITPIGRVQRLTGPVIGTYRTTAKPSGDLGWQATGDIALKERFAHGWQAYASYGKYIRYPNFYEIYGDGINIVARADSLGNVEELLPEIGRTFDAGLGWDGNLASKLGAHGRLTYFQRNTDNNITLIQTPAESYYTNTGYTLEHGVEFEGSTHYSNFASLQTAITAQDGWYPRNAYYIWGQPIPMIAAPGYRIPTMNAPNLTADARLDLHFFGDKLTTFYELKYKGRNIIQLQPTQSSDAGIPGQPVYNGLLEYENPLNTFDLGAHYKLPHGGTLSGGVTDLLDHGPKQTLGGSAGSYTNTFGLTGNYQWWTCGGQMYTSYSGAGQYCAPYQITAYNYSFPVKQNVYFPEQGRTLYIILAWQLDALHRH